jgi:hypothetical protein
MGDGMGDGGEVAFAGKCAEHNYQNPLTEYRDTVRPYMDLVDLFLEIVTDESVWSDFNDFDLGEGKYAR